MLQRDAVRTRRALLDAAARLLTQQGGALRLDAVARAAGVSKGGLLHHFPSKDALLVGLVEEWLARFDAAVERRLDPADTAPGRLTRAYIEANLDDDPDLGDGPWRSPTVLSALVAVPEVLARAREDDQRWRAALAQDGLHPQVVRVITGVLDGMLTGQLLTGDLGPDDRRATRSLLLALTERPGPLVADATS